MDRFKGFLWLFLFGLIWIFTSCIRDVYDLDKRTDSFWDPKWCAHVVHSEMSIKDIIEQDSFAFIKEDNKNFLTVLYRSTVFSKTAAEVINVPNQALSKHYTFNVPSIFLTGDTTFSSYVTDYIFNMSNNEELDSILIDTLKIRLQVSTNLNHSCRLKIRTANITKDDSIFQFSIAHIYTGSIPVNFDTTFELTGCKIFLDNSGVIKNKFPFNLDVIAYSNGLPVNNPYDVNINFYFENIKFQSVYGYLGQKLFPVKEDTVDINMFENNVIGSFKFYEPKFNFYISNSFGIPISLHFNKLVAHSDKNPPFNVTLSGSGIPNPWYINTPIKAGNTDSTKMHLDNTNCNMIAAFDISPISFIYQLDANTNPNGHLYQNFVLSKSRFKVEAEAEIPLHASASDFVLEDTLDIDIMEAFKQADKMKFVNFLLKIQNDFPLEAKVQVYLVDSNATWPPIDSLLDFSVNTIEAAAPGPPPDLKTVQAVTSFKKLSFPAVRVKNWKDVSRLIIKASLSTYSNGTVPVKIYSDYKVKVDIGIQTQLNIGL